MSRRLRGVVVAVLFLASTVAFMAGSALIGWFLDGAGPLGALAAGVALEACTAVAVLAIAVVVRPVLQEATPGLAGAYLGLRAAECLVILAVGGWFLLTRTPWAPHELLVYAATGVAGVVLSVALLRGRLVPTPLALLGLLGYAALLAGGVLDAAGVVSLGSAAGAAFYVPGAVFEVALPVWLLVRGFGPAGGRPSTTDAQAVAQAIETSSAAPAPDASSPGPASAAAASAAAPSR